MVILAQHGLSCGHPPSQAFPWSTSGFLDIDVSTLLFIAFLIEREHGFRNQVGFSTAQVFPTPF
jgi:hypothetical protein